MYLILFEGQMLLKRGRFQRTKIPLLIVSDGLVWPSDLPLETQSLLCDFDVEPLTPGEGSDYNLCSASMSGGGIGNIVRCRRTGRDDTPIRDPGSLWHSWGLDLAQVPRIQCPIFWVRFWYLAFFHNVLSSAKKIKVSFCCL